MTAPESIIRCENFFWVLEQTERDADVRSDGAEQALVVNLRAIDFVADGMAGHQVGGEGNEQVFQIRGSGFFVKPQIV